MQVRYRYTTHVSLAYGLEGQHLFKGCTFKALLGNNGQIATFFNYGKFIFLKMCRFFKYSYGYNLES